MIEALLTSPLSLAIGVGIVVTALLGRLCDPFLKISVTVKFPVEFEEFEDSEKGGGGKELGILERLLFFASAWLETYVIGGGWLTFKVAAKWASWQHITKVPETLKQEHLRGRHITYLGADDRKYMDARRTLSSRLLGRFLNGTLYNIFCAGVGWVCGKTLLAYIYSFRPEDDLRYWIVGVFIGVAGLIGWPLIGAPFFKLIKERMGNNEDWEKQT
jgi:hypothetical protein